MRNAVYVDGLPERQRDVLWLWSRGYRYTQIAAELGIAVSTVKTNLERIKERLGVTTKIGLFEAAHSMLCDAPPGHHEQTRIDVDTPKGAVK